MSMLFIQIFYVNIKILRGFKCVTFFLRKFDRQLKLYAINVVQVVNNYVCYISY